MGVDWPNWAIYFPRLNYNQKLSLRRAFTLLHKHSAGAAGTVLSQWASKVFLDHNHITAKVNIVVCHLFLGKPEGLM